MAKNISALLHTKTLRFYSLEPFGEVVYAKTEDLIVPERLDILARRLFAEQLLGRNRSDFGEDLYYQLLDLQSHGFSECDPGKSKFIDYVDQFSALVSSFRRSGYDAEQSIIPCCHGVPVDGAHRIAAAHAVGIDRLPTISVRGDVQRLNDVFYRNIGLKEESLRLLLLELVKIKRNSRAAVFFPCAKRYWSGGMTLLNSNYRILGSFDLVLSKNGLYNLINILYGDLDWWDDYQCRSFNKRRWRANVATRVVLFENDVSKDIQVVKDEIRSVMKCGNDSVHTTDFHHETINLLRTVSTDAGLHYIKYKVNHLPSNFSAYLNSFRSRVADLGGNLDHYCVDYGGTLAIYGLRDTADLDYLQIDGTVDIEDEPAKINLHNWKHRSHPTSINKIIDDPRFHIVVDGVKYVGMDLVSYIKSREFRAKDRDDLIRIAALGSFFPKVRFHTIAARRWLREAYSTGASIAFIAAASLAKRIVPRKYHPRLRRLYINMRR